MDYALIKAAVAAVIKENGNEEITGNILQQALLAVIDVLGFGYQYMGIATPSTNPGTPDAKVFYIAQAEGTYSNFNDGSSSPVLDGTAIGLFAFDTQWHNTILDVATKSSVVAIVQGINEALADKIDKVAGATPGNIPQFGNDGALTDSDIPATDVATKQELAVASLPGLAEAVIDTDGAGTEQQFTFRKSGGDGGAYYRKVKGKTIVWNQLLDIANGSGSVNGISYSINNGIITLNGTATAITPITISGNSFGIPVGHKVLFGISKNFNFDNPTSLMLHNSWAISADLSSGSVIVESNSAVPDYWTLRINEGVSFTNDSFYLGITDLTLAGIADEISTPADFEALYPGYHPYNPGTLKSNDAEAVETTGVNQWDEDWELGSLNVTSGEEEGNDNYTRCKNFIPVIGGSTYYFLTPNAAFYVLKYDSNKNYLDWNIFSNASLELDANVAYIKIVWLNTDYGKVYKNDICINFSDPAINGQYFPYWKRVLQLGLTTRQDTDGNVPFADGMKGAGTASDWADKVGGEKRMVRVNLGDLAWNNVGSEFFAINNFGAKHTDVNMICPRYTPVAYSSQMTDKTVHIDSNGQIYVRDSAYSDAATFKAAMDGVYLDAELATPVPFTWAEPLNLGVKVDENGTEKAVAPEGATAPSAPFVADTTYTMSIARMVQKLALI